MKKLLSGLLVLVLLVTVLPGCKTNKKDLNGLDISEYTIVYSQESPDYCQRAAEYIQAQIQARTGVQLSVCEASSGTYAHEIVVGETSRAISQSLNAETNNVEFAILADDNHIALEGDFFIIAAAAHYFVETYIPGSNFDSKIPKETSIHQPITAAPNNYILLSFKS